MKPRNLPTDSDLEASVIQGLFRKPNEWFNISGVLNPLAFSDLFHRDIFFAFVHYMELGQAPDIRMVRDWMLKKPIWEEIADILQYKISTLISQFPVGGLRVNAVKLMDVYFRRELMVRCERFYEIGAKSKHGLESVSNLANELQDLVNGIRGNTEVLSWEQGETLLKHLEQIQTDKKEKGMTGITTGSKMLDEEIGGLQKSDLIIVAAKTNVGKTPFMIQMAESAAEKTGNPSAYFTLEVENLKILMKMMARASGVTMKEMVTGNIQDSGWSDITGRGMTNFLKKKIIVEDRPGLDIEEIKSASRMMKAKYGIGAIFVDYLQLAHAKKIKGNRELEIGHIAQELKNLAKELNIPVVAGSQFSRSISATKEQIPQLQHLRESGNIEQAADTILFLYRPELYEVEQIEIRETRLDTKGVTLVIVGKHRLGFARIGIETAIPMMYHVPERYEDIPLLNSGAPIQPFKPTSKPDFYFQGND